MQYNEKKFCARFCKYLANHILQKNLVFYLKRIFWFFQDACKFCLIPANFATIYYYYYYYQIYQLGTGRHTQKAQACTRCLPITKELKTTNRTGQIINRKKSTPRLDWNHRPPGNRPGTTLGGQAWRGHLRDKF